MSDRERIERLLPALFVACFVAAYAFWQVGADVHQGGMAGVDAAVRDAVMRDRPLIAVAFFEAISFMGNKYVLAPIAAIAAWWLAGRNLTAAALMLLCGFVSAEFVDVLKTLFAITRPETGSLERHSASFPSGHVSGTASLAFFTWFVAARHGRLSRIVASIGIALVALMAMSRVYLDMHWTSDVIGGMLVGGVMGLGFSALYEWYRLRQLRSAAARGSSPS